ncbi:MAG: dTMP kinase [Solirubrobacteraceae bacterium]|nr:dTMP kinase [Solirubrobacteraceae bacterium]
MTDERPPRGRFVVFEGLDGSGTTTQVARLGERLSELGRSVELTKEPSNGPLGAVLRQAIEGRLRLDPTAMALAFAADRADHLFNEHNGIVGLLERGHWVLCDRYVLSSLAYQPSEQIGADWLEEANAFAIAPDMTVFVDVDVATCMQRISARSAADELFHQDDHLARVRANYHRVLSDGPALGELLVVDGSGPIEDVEEEIWRGVKERLIDAAEGAREDLGVAPNARPQSA